MCALFGAGVTVHRAVFSPPAPPVHDESLAVPLSIVQSPLLAPIVHKGALPAAPVRSQPGAIPPIGVSSRHEAPPLEAPARHQVWLELPLDRNMLAPARLSTRVQRVPHVGLSTRLNAMPEMPAPRIRRDLAHALGCEVLRRGVPARYLTPEQVRHWQKRVSDAKRVSLRLVKLVWIFPNLPLVDDQPVKYKADQGAIAVVLTPRPVPLTTVVIATHEGSGKTLVCRFAQG